MAARQNSIAIAAAALLSHFCLLASATPGTANFFPAIGILSLCSSATSPPGTTVYAAKASDALWVNGTACGKTYCVGRECIECTLRVKPINCLNCLGPFGSLELEFCGDE
ncbi:hypothetical protein KSP40_PGU002673 [Platanthera guangdongensis]|uniref:Uncharacterized protein n=1 Tax=Platanthera guangdongensis TaxID=2320717 RepID=A0ABR2LTV1_9ASPA